MIEHQDVELFEESFETFDNLQLYREHCDELLKEGNEIPTYTEFISFMNE